MAKEVCGNCESFSECKRVDGAGKNDEVCEDYEVKPKKKSATKKGSGITAKSLDFSDADATMASVFSPKSKYAKEFAKNKGIKVKELFVGGKIARGDMVGIISAYIRAEGIAD